MWQTALILYTLGMLPFWLVLNHVVVPRLEANRGRPVADRSLVVAVLIWPAIIAGAVAWQISDRMAGKP